MWFFLYVLHNDLFFLSNFGILAIDNNIDEVSDPYHYTIIALKLLFNSLKLKRVRLVVCQRARYFQVSDKSKESRVLGFVNEILYLANQLHSNA